MILHQSVLICHKGLYLTIRSGILIYQSQHSFPVAQNSSFLNFNQPLTFYFPESMDLNRKFTFVKTEKTCMIDGRSSCHGTSKLFTMRVHSGVIHQAGHLQAVGPSRKVYSLVNQYAALGLVKVCNQFRINTTNDRFFDFVLKLLHKMSDSQ